MSRKMIIIVSAVLAFFAGAIWVSEVPVVATLVAFLEVCAGFACGYFFHEARVAEISTAHEEEVMSLKNAVKSAKEELAKKSDELVSLQTAVAPAENKTAAKTSKKSNKTKASE